MKNIEELIKKYEKIDPELVETLKDLSEQLKNNENMQSIFRHEIRTPLVPLLGYTQLLISGKTPHKDINKTYSIMIESANYMKDLIELLEMHSMSEEELRTNAPRINLEKMMMRMQEGYSAELKKENIGLRLRVDNYNGEPIRIWLKRGPTRALLATPLGNAANHSLKDRKIIQGIRVNKENNLEIITENTYGNEQQRKIHGQNQNIGFFIVEKIVNTLGGKFEIYHETRIPSNYQKSYKYADLDTKNWSKTIFGMLIEIPMAKLGELKSD